MDFGYILTSTQGRIPRSQWWAGSIVLAVILLILLLLISYVIGGPMTTVGRIANLILLIIFLYPSYAVSAKRFQDRDKPGSLALIPIGLSVLHELAGLIGLLGEPMNPNVLDWIFFVAFAIVVIWYLIELGILRGTIGPNTFGPDPLEGRP